MNIIPKTKFGDCSECGTKNTNVVKIKKDLLCLECNANAKRKQYVERANNKVKSREENIDDRHSLTVDLDIVFSRYIRLRESDKNGNVECYTCSSKDHWTKMQCGHYIKRSDTLLRWDSRNAKIQCVECNCNKHGNIDAYTENLEKEYPGLPEQLKLESREVNKYGRDDLKQLLIDYRAKLKLVEKRFKD